MPIDSVTFVSAFVTLLVIMDPPGGWKNWREQADLHDIDVIIICSDIPIAVLVPKVMLKKRLNVARLVAACIPSLSMGIEKQIRMID